MKKETKKEYINHAWEQLNDKSDSCSECDKPRFDKVHYYVPFPEGVKSKPVQFDSLDRMKQEEITKEFIKQTLSNIALLVRSGVWPKY